MPSAYEASRDFLRRSIAGVRSSLVDQGEGPAIKVEPFDANNASTGAGLLKLATSVAAAHRAKSNFARQQADAQLKREYMQAQIAEIRAHGKYYEQGGAKTHGGAVLGAEVKDPDTGEVYPATTPVAAFNAKRNLRRDSETRGSRGKVAAARAAIGNINAMIGREAERHAGLAMRVADPYLAAITGTNPQLREDALRAFRERVGLDLSAYVTPKMADGTDQALYMGEITARQKQMRAQVEAAFKAQATRVLESRYAQQRQPHEATIASQAASTAADAQDIAAPVPSDVGGEDPLGVLGPEGP